MTEKLRKELLRGGFMKGPPHGVTRTLVLSLYAALLASALAPCSSNKPGVHYAQAWRRKERFSPSKSKIFMMTLNGSNGVVCPLLNQLPNLGGGD